MMQKLVRTWLILALLIANTAEAGGFGWYVYSFNWNSFNDVLPYVERGFDGWPARQKAKDKNEVALLFERHIVGTLTIGDERFAFMGVHESPRHNEFYSPAALRMAFELVSKKNQRTLLRYFDFGKPLPKHPQRTTCIDRNSKDWGACQTVVFFDPSEVRALGRDVASLAIALDTPDQKLQELLHLDGVLRKAVAEGRALMFWSQD